MLPLNIIQNNNVQSSSYVKNGFKVSHFESQTKNKNKTNNEVPIIGEENVNFIRNENPLMYKHVRMLAPRPIGKRPNEIVKTRLQQNTVPVLPYVEEDLTDIPLREEIKIDLSAVSKLYDRRGIDFPPFYRVYDYESRFDEEDMIPLMIENDAVFRRKPMKFGKELEYRALRNTVKRIDYLLYYLFGVDRYGYFELYNERQSFYNFPMKHYIEALNQKDDSLYTSQDNFEEHDFDLESSDNSMTEYYGI